MKFKVGKVTGVELVGKPSVVIELSFDESSKMGESDLVIEKSTTEITLPVEKFSERLMIETLKKAWKTQKGIRKGVDKISKKILGKEYEI